MIDPMEILLRGVLPLGLIGAAWWAQIREYRRQKRVRQHLNGDG